MAAAVTYSNFCGMLVHENRGGVELDYVPDTLGSLAATIDSNQTFQFKADYWPYGEVASSTGSNPSSWGFVGLLGYFADIVSKLLYVRLRHLRPDLARWQTPDLLFPIEPSYAYVGLRPTGGTDPLGLGIELGAPGWWLTAAARCAFLLALEHLLDWILPGGAPVSVQLKRCKACCLMM